MDKAQSAFDHGDWYSAHYYAQAAIAADPRRRDAVRLAAEAGNKIGGLAGSKDQQAAELFAQKKDALARLENNDALGAYYMFIALAAKNPKDQDIATYLARARDALKDTSFFLDDALKMQNLPGTQGILFLNGAAAGALEAVSIGKMVELVSQEAYFYDIEAVRYDPAGNVLWHFTAPYGMRTAGNTILMRTIDRTNPAVQYLPLYIKGARGAGERNILPLQPTPEELRALSTSRDALAGMSISELLRMRSDLGAFGLARQELAVDMVMKLLMPFAFLIISLFAVSLGWAFRARYLSGRLPAVGVILVPHRSDRARPAHAALSLRPQDRGRLRRARLRSARCVDRPCPPPGPAPRPFPGHARGTVHEVGGAQPRRKPPRPTARKPRRLVGQSGFPVS